MLNEFIMVLDRLSTLTSFQEFDRVHGVVIITAKQIYWIQRAFKLLAGSNPSSGVLKVYNNFFIYLFFIYWFI